MAIIAYLDMSPWRVPQSEGALRLPIDSRGTGVVAGVTKVNAVPTPCRVLLFDEDHTLLSSALTQLPACGYSFTGLAPGAYYLVVKTNGDSRRAMVEHVILP